MNWHYAVGEQQHGPISQQNFEGLIRDGVIHHDTLIWCQGMPTWQPWSKVRSPALTQTFQTAGLPSRTDTCGECGGHFDAEELVQIKGCAVCAACKPLHLQRLKEGSDPATHHVKREGDALLCSTDATLPSQCTRCNAPVSQPPLKRTLYWHNPWIYALVLASIWIYVIVALCVRKKGILLFNVCPLHRSQHTRWVVLSWVAGLGSLGGFALLLSANNWAAAIGVLIVGLTACIVGATKARYVYATRIDGLQMRVKGFGPEFLSNYP